MRERKKMSVGGIGDVQHHEKIEGLLFLVTPKILKKINLIGSFYVFVCTFFLLLMLLFELPRDIYY